ncbi:DUF1638 domain-containing protein [Methanosarcina sp. DH2]|jgi:hypothetical protein|uniref:DUF1638 domain-containing protein n=1 Tax=Methanosarcina sp. DH2 TaxID=2605639 RepID=UPI001E5A2477|nr:DUF1638 domain-containing protein [Methanosarcina sp. DH2]MCC4769140.1 DUF1638 domain-containing protein [Methanosarcina sp. DH2]
MPIMTIIGCRIFEDEVVHLIEKESGLDRVIVLKNENNAGLIRKLEENGNSYIVLPIEEIRRVLERKERNEERKGEKREESSGLTLVVNLLEFALDGFPDRLREAVYETIEDMKKYSDAVLLLYGLCGNVLGSIEKDFEASGFPVFILTDRGGEIVDDCVGAVLGGRGAFLSKLKSEGTGTYFLTPVGAAYWKEMLVASRITPDPENIEMTKMVFDYSGYKNVAKVDTGLHYEKEFETKVREFAESFGFEIVDMEGSPDLIERCYERAREEVLRGKKRGNEEGDAP